MDSDDTRELRSNRLGRILSVLGGILAAPFLITGLFRVTQFVDSTAVWLLVPFGTAALVALVLLRFDGLKPLGTGMAVGTVLWAVCLLVLILAMGWGRPIP